MELPLSSRYSIIERLQGHIPNMGRSAGEELNWAYKLLDTESKTECIGMFCKPNHITFIDKETWNKLTTNYKSSLTWYLGSQGYITRTVKDNDEVPYFTLHQLIVDYYGNGKGQKSVDHINRNKLDNRSSNLTIVDQSEQNRNRDKVARHINAQELPPEVHVPLPKFCVYYNECYNKEKNLWRNFFTIEGHPKQNGKRKATTKSMKEEITILDKLQQAKDILYELDNGIPPPKETKLEENKETIPAPPFTPTHTISKVKQDSLPTQWKVSNIYTYLTTGKEELYKTYVKGNNPELTDEQFESLLTQVKNSSKEDATQLIKDFVETLRTKRHNALSKSKNDEMRFREDKQIWDSKDVLEALHQDKIHLFKEHTEKASGDNPEDPKWCKRWDEFLQSLREEESEEAQKSLITKFFAAQRAKRQRRKV